MKLRSPTTASSSRTESSGSQGGLWAELTESLNEREFFRFGLFDIKILIRTEVSLTL